ncbi:MAG: cation transporter [Bacillota bacterium]|uniref:Copper chaperone CopZ n=2 Tax=Carboxydocella TaxID=178898 RepID=A0A1T4PKG2_9FIRM|nr:MULTISPECIES: cation transporter [Carboxydocella]AVX19499.1 copper chaperone [Carboxydocella thermautotrophica]AVX29917.1 copper chaperone [Carboxydocella thermautotrophica]SJZ92035.1 copper chaperone [Carboxydocella sporoproducens DSM 16521]GAW29022.1 copper ion-binding protein [Carboxydocella sp. ULO1]GAW30887.1 copper ion-binding protein [Carboxydocella sp. JDF658]
MAQVVINVEGMSCGHCKMAVEKALKQVGGVTEAVVDLAAKQVTVTYDENQTGLAALHAAIEEAGYDVVK